VFVVDNASTDATVSLVRAVPAGDPHRNQENRWFSAANNQAIRQGHGRHVLCLNPDTVVGTNALTEMVVSR
jgi:GT2 family glycosyltransferase